MDVPRMRIDGVKVKTLRTIPDDRGHLTEILRCDDEFFVKFGQVYCTTTYPGVVKAWHYHKVQWDHITCVRGMIKVALWDGRQSSPTAGTLNEFYLGDHDPMLLVIPPMVYHGWKCTGLEEAYIINLPTEPYNHEVPDEFRLPAHANGIIPYDWSRVDR